MQWRLGNLRNWCVSLLYLFGSQGLIQTVAQTYGAHFVVGVDIDDALIHAAWRRRRAVWSTQAPPHLEPGQMVKPSEPTTTTRNYFPTSCEHEFGSLPIPPSSITKEKLSFPHNLSSSAPLVEPSERTTTRINYFPISCEHEFGSLPIPPSSTTRGKLSFPHNLSFRAADWMKTEIPEDREGYDVVLAWVIPVGFGDGSCLTRYILSPLPTEVSRSPSGYTSTREMKALRLFSDEHTTFWNPVEASCSNHSLGSLMRRLGEWTP